MLHFRVPMAIAARSARPGPRSARPWLAALLSFVFPGLGQAYAGQLRAALLLAAPVAILALAALAALNGVGDVRNGLLSSSFLVAALALNIALFAWRAFAIAHAPMQPLLEPNVAPRERRIGLTTAALLVVVAVAMHAWVGLVVGQLDDTLRQVFDRTPISEPIAGPDDGDGGKGDEPVAAEEPVNRPEYRWDGTERINILLIGTDAHPSREAVLTDVVLVVSVDPVAETAVMISIPRDTGYLPMPDESLFVGGLFPDKVNEIALRASLDPATWCPDLADEPTACGLRSLERSVGLYLGIEIHHYAMVDMAGFAELVDALGGLTLCLPGQLTDPEFDGTLGNLQRSEALVLPAGCHPYDGLDALAYARSRKGWIDMPDGERVYQNDFSRNERQQKLLLALRAELAEGDLFFELPAVLRAIGRSVSTDVPRDQAGDLASLLPLITGPDIERVVLDYPEFVELPADPNANYLLLPRRDAIRAEMARLFGDEALRGWYLGTTAATPSAAEAEGGGQAN